MPPALILHHYDTSPFSENIRKLFAHKRLAWRAVEQPTIMPKPEAMRANQNCTKARCWSSESLGIGGSVGKADYRRWPARRTAPLPKDFTTTCPPAA